MHSVTDCEVGSLIIHWVNQDQSIEALYGFVRFHQAFVCLHWCWDIALFVGMVDDGYFLIDVVRFIMWSCQCTVRERLRVSGMSDSGNKRMFIGGAIFTPPCKKREFERPRSVVFCQKTIRKMRNNSTEWIGILLKQ